MTPSVMKPIWASEEYATNRFRSGVVQAASSRTDADHREGQDDRRMLTSASGNSPTAKRSSPYVPSLASSADISIEPAVGASAYVSGDHVCRGQIGAFTAKAMAKAMKATPRCRGTSPSPRARYRRRSARAGSWCWCAKARYKMPISKNAEPVKV